MRTAFRIFLLAIGLVSSLGAATGRAGALIEFPNLPEQAPASLRGYLARPDAGLSAILDSRTAERLPEGQQKGGATKSRARGFRDRTCQIRQAR
jgi:predicted small lipoprotein YifL